MLYTCMYVHTGIFTCALVWYSPNIQMNACVINSVKLHRKFDIVNLKEI